jgi:Bacterial Ig domain/Right handed beta helix region
MKPDMKQHLYFVCIMLVMLSVPVAGATNYYVSTTGSDSNNCLSSGTPCLTTAHAESLSSAGDTINIAAGTYRLSTSNSKSAGVISAKANQTFIGPSCTPTSAKCTAIISGGVIIGGNGCISPCAAGPDGNGNWSVTGQTQAGTVNTFACDPGWSGCNYPEDLFFDGVALQAVSSAVTITWFTGTSGTLTFSALNTLVSGNTVTLSGFTAPNTGLNGQTVTVLSTGLSGSQFEASVTGSSYASGSGTGKVANITTTLATNTWWFDYTNHTIYFHRNPSGHTVETSVLETMFQPNGVNGVILQNLTIQEFAAPTDAGAIDPSFGSTVSSTASLNWTIQNCYLTLNHGSGIRGAFGMQILNNVSTGNGQFGFGGGIPAGSSITPSGLVIQSNTVSYNNYAHVSPAYGAGGIKFGNTADAVIRANNITRNIGDGLHFDVNSINPLIHGNKVTYNADPASTGSGIEFEISNVGISNPSAIIRNNIIQYNGTGAATGPNYQIESLDSEGMLAYCNVMEVDSTSREQVWAVVASDRGNNTQPPNSGTYMVSTSNDVLYNTIIFDSGALGTVGYLQTDLTHQSTFFTSNTPPDHNQYHASSTTIQQFIYDNNKSGSNTPKSFTDYQSAGADVHGSIDTAYTSGFPTVAISSPADQSTVTSPVTIHATASDSSGISKVEFYADWTLLATVMSSPYNYSWSGSSGTHIVTAMAYSNAGIRNCWAVTLTVP